MMGKLYSQECRSNERVFRCTCCGQCFADDFELREINEEGSTNQVLCDYCVATMENTGELTRCECCGNLFAPSRLKVNSENGLQEICPMCGEVWCE